MAEAIISRATFVEDQLPFVPGYHTVMVAVKTPEGRLLPNFPISCNDGEAVYSYMTNEKGKTIFMCNSGAANIHLSNNINGCQYLDFKDAWYNIDAPSGLNTIVEAKMEFGDNFYDFETNKLFGFACVRDCDLHIVGAGGGGGWSKYVYYASGGGGSGYMNNYYNQILQGEYNFIVGAGGGGAGGTSYIANSSYSAIGGGAGTSYEQATYPVFYGGIGGLGNGAEGGHQITRRGEDSPVDFAGGGGSSGSNKSGVSPGGKPYGGGSDRSPSRGGGGCGGGGVTHKSQAGGNGMMRIIIHY